MTYRSNGPLESFSLYTYYRDDNGPYDQPNFYVSHDGSEYEKVTPQIYNDGDNVNLVVYELRNFRKDAKYLKIEFTGSDIAKSPVIGKAVLNGPLGVTANLPSGSVPYGTMVMLERAAAGDTVYYTTDGSDPRTSLTRKLYASPIIVVNELQLKITAVKKSASGKKAASRVSDYHYIPESSLDTAVGMLDPLDNFKQVYSKSSIYIAKDTPYYFGNDLHRIARTPQVSNVTFNRSTASVKVQSTRSTESLHTVLTTASSGAKIYYRLNKGLTFQLYSKPLELTGYNVLETYAVKDGMDPSPIRKYTFNASNHIQVDRFGQMISATFPEKVITDQQLVADAEADASYYAGLTPPSGRDRFGGLAGSAAKYGLQNKGFFSIQQMGSRKVMTTPEGNLFFSLGVNALTANETFTMVKGREELFESIPSIQEEYKTAYNGTDNFSFYLANKYRKTGVVPTEHAIYSEAVLRIKKWGFNSVGGFSPDKYGSENNLPYVRMLPLSSMSWAKIDGISIFDIFAPDAESKIDKAFASAVKPTKDDPMLIGYFIDNEYDFHKFYSGVPKLKASKAAIKGHWVKRLKDKYQDINKFNSEWQTSFKSFEDLKEAELPLGTSAAWRDTDEFFRYYLDTFYGTVSRLYRKYDPNHLLLGDRWLTTPFHNEKL
ncbi:chitobiase/beta-hexosaminidase C-terminal domain-containing protein, partial [Paenibacillus sp. MCAF20]